MVDSGIIDNDKNLGNENESNEDLILNNNESNQYSEDKEILNEHLDIIQLSIDNIVDNEDSIPSDEEYAEQ